MTYILYKKVTENVCENDQMLALTEKDFKVAVVNVFIELKESMTKEVKEGMMTMVHQDNIKREKF